MAQFGSDVRISAYGRISTTGLTLQFSNVAAIDGRFDANDDAQVGAGNFDIYNAGISSQTLSLGDIASPSITASSGSGDVIGFYPGISNPELRVPTGYASNSLIQGVSIYTGRTLVSMNINKSPGYIEDFTLDNGETIRVLVGPMTFTIDINQVGNDVVFSTSGSLSLAGLTFDDSFSVGSGLIRPSDRIAVGRAPSRVQYSDDIVGAPTSLELGSTSDRFTPTTSSGGYISFNPSNNAIVVSRDYVPGDPLEGTSTFANTTYADLGITVAGGYTRDWTLTNGDIIRINVNPASPVSGGANGDPHFVRWGQDHHDTFHGGCDQNLVSTHKIKVFMRNVIRKNSYSFIEKIAILLGDHVLEIDPKHSLVDNVLLQDDTTFPLDVGLFENDHQTHPVTIHKLGKKEYKIEWGTGSHIDIKAKGIFMNVQVNGNEDDFADAVGLMGEYGTGQMLDHQGNPMTNMTAYGMEWQVKPDLGDPKLFSVDLAPQWPEPCHLPQDYNNNNGAAVERRNLRSDQALTTKAEQACQGAKDFDICVNDVLLTGEFGLAETFFKQEVNSL